MRTETKLGLFATCLLLTASCGDEFNPEGSGGAAGLGGGNHGGASIGGVRNTGGTMIAIMPMIGGRGSGGERIFPILPLDTGGRATGGVRNTGGHVIAILPMNTGGHGAGGPRNTGGEVIGILPIPPTASESESTGRESPADDAWWRAAEAALRST